MIFRFAIAYQPNPASSADMQILEPCRAGEEHGGDGTPIAIGVNRFIPASFVFRCKAVPLAAARQSGAKAFGA